MLLNQTFTALQADFEDKIGANHIFDLKKRPFSVGENDAVCYFIIGYTDSEWMQRILASLQRIPTDKMPADMDCLLRQYMPFASAEITSDPIQAASELLRGSTVFIINGYRDYLIADARRFSSRSTQEPDKDRTLRGPHIGMTESLIENLIQIRRYMRTDHLQTERFLLGNKIKNEVAILSLKGHTDEKLLEYVRKRLTDVKLPALSMTQESLAQLIFPNKGLSVFNPFPRIRYTERPDVVAATLMEGKIAILCDNSPCVMLLPECIFDFFEEADDYYFPPFTASYLRTVRCFVFFASVFLIPIWLLVVRYAGNVPETFRFILTEGEYAVPLFLQFLIIELALDGLKMASLNTRAPFPIPSPSSEDCSWENLP